MEKVKEISKMKTGKLDTACLRYDLGRNTMRRVASEAGAVVKLGKCYLINFTKVDAYMDEMAK